MKMNTKLSLVDILLSKFGLMKIRYTADSFKSHAELVADFNYVVLDIEFEPEIGLPSSSSMELSMAQLLEELEELDDAVKRNDVVDAADALIDGIYFAYGVMYKMGISPDKIDAIFRTVHKANTSKMIGIKDGREGFNAVDAVKPDGWTPPEDAIRGILWEK